MFDIISLEQGQFLKLPLALAQHFQPTDRFIAWSEGDVIHFKRITPSLLTQVADFDAEDAPAFDEIDDLIHRHRDLRHVKN